MLAYFGYPSAHENIAERAIRASLATIAAGSQLDTADGQPVHAHIGIADRQRRHRQPAGRGFRT